MKIGSHKIANPVIAAPMAGVTDKPYRHICRENGAGMVVSEMVTSQLDLRHSTKSRYRLDLSGEPEPVVVQIVGTDPHELAQAAQYNVANGAQIIDINMGCPAKKVCKKAAGSALLANESLVSDILSTVVASVDVPVTVKIRTGQKPEERNGIAIAKIAEDAGVQCITVHGRTRQCKFVGEVEYDTIASIKTIKPSLLKRANMICNHVRAIHEFYGDLLGVRLARKHIKWYLQHWDTAINEKDRQQINATDDPAVQYTLVETLLLN